MLKGNETLLLIGGVRLASQRSLSINRQTDTIEVCSPVDGAAKRFVPSTTSWNVQAGGLYANKAGAERLKGIWRKYQNGDMTPLDVSIQTASGTETGEAILTDLHETGNLNELVQFSIQLQGSGVLYKEQRMECSEGQRGFRMVFDAEDVRYEQMLGPTVWYLDLNLVSGGKIKLDCEGDPSLWAICPGLHGEQDIRRDMLYVARGIGDGVVEIKDPGLYCVMTDDYDTVPVVTITTME